MTTRFGPVLTPLALLTLLGGGCASRATEGVREDGTPWRENVAETVSQVHIDTLERDLASLAPHVDQAEAKVLADVAIRHAAKIADEYDMVRPIELHNTLVNLGLRKRGLCYQCAEDMYVRIRDLRLHTFDLHWGVAYADQLYLEHSCVIVTARGRPFKEGIVLDPWRREGRLRWAKVSEDRYPWEKWLKPRLEIIGRPAPSQTARVPATPTPPATQAAGRVRATPAPVEARSTGGSKGAGAN